MVKFFNLFNIKQAGSRYKGKFTAAVEDGYLKQRHVYI